MRAEALWYEIFPQLGRGVKNLVTFLDERQRAFSRIFSPKSRRPPCYTQCKKRCFGARFLVKRLRRALTGSRKSRREGRSGCPCDGARPGEKTKGERGTVAQCSASRRRGAAQRHRGGRAGVRKSRYPWGGRGANPCPSCSRTVSRSQVCRFVFVFFSLFRDLFSVGFGLPTPHRSRCFDCFEVSRLKILYAVIEN